jgi:hypothetical protein
MYHLKAWDITGIFFTKKYSNNGIQLPQIVNQSLKEGLGLSHFKK